MSQRRGAADSRVKTQVPAKRTPPMTGVNTKAGSADKPGLRDTPVQEPARASRNAKTKALANQIWLQDAGGARKRAAPSNTTVHAKRAAPSNTTQDAAENVKRTKNHRDNEASRKRSRTDRMRFRAAELESDNSEDDLIPAKSNGKGRQPQENSSAVAPSDSEYLSHDEGENLSGESENELEEVEDEEDGLERLDPRRLAEELDKEVASWNMSDEEQPHGNTRVNRTSTARKSSRRRAPSAAELFDDDDDISVVHPPKKGKTVNKASKGKRQLAHEAEVPQWSGQLPQTPVKKRGAAVKIPVSPSSLNYPGDNEDDQSDQDSQNDEDNEEHMQPPPAPPPAIVPAGTDLVLNERGRVNLRDQPLLVQAIAREAIKSDAFPEIGGRTVLSQDCLVSAAQQSARYHQILNRLVNEDGYGKALGQIPDGRISTWRRLAYSIGSNHVVGGYGLRPGCEKLVAGLLKRQRYIFPVTPEIREHEPYKHPTILAIMQALYFSGSGALGVQHVDRFASSLATDPDAEVPISMVALVATAVRSLLLCHYLKADAFVKIHNSLMEWQTGTRSPREFSALNCGDVYRTHVGILEKIKSNKPVFFHRMMSDLYRDARAATAPEARVDSEDSAFALMDLSAYN
ncbi:hypothetical protein OE88DRAFT_1648740 [Heliocybe sulcata]|uniref:DUF6532 domain-containing protein n=1 Tax=Heliocybe sulcata TaxID=5364 RepID=A0A5C3MMQ2_9AGAM|nr:hypothetical protein OE88DRAFT_1648740 [Heliocybe sulcata]